MDQEKNTSGGKPRTMTYSVHGVERRVVEYKPYEQLSRNGKWKRYRRHPDIYSKPVNTPKPKAPPVIRCYWCLCPYRGDKCPECQTPYDPVKQKAFDERQSKWAGYGKEPTDYFDYHGVNKKLTLWLKKRKELGESTTEG